VIPTVQGVRSTVGNVLFRALVMRTRELPLDAIAGQSPASTSALVLAPHFDDEVLGCGGTMVRMRKMGIDVHVWFLTDGATSHDRILPPAEVTAIRQAEAWRATALLGVPADNVTMWGYPDSRLSEAVGPASDALAERYENLRPRLVFAPYRHDGPADHESCTAIGRRLAEQAGGPVTFLEYPVWAWNQWPWSRIPLRGRTEMPLRAVASFSDNIRIFKDWNAHVSIGSCKHLKIKALDEYKSQMTRLVPTEQWGILGDVGNGTFLENFMRDYELFSVRQLN
jgi:LmbE family N-acetylglucosaminyl deacetylase